MFARGGAAPIVLLASLAAQPFLPAGAAVAQQVASAPLPTPEPAWDMIAFEVRSWGAPVYAWQYTPQYGGVHIERLEADTDQPGQYKFAFRPLAEDQSRYAALEAIIRDLPQPTPDSADCQTFVPDMAYGTIRLTHGATTTEITWNSGCQDRDYAGFLSALRAADTLVGGWARDLPVDRTESHFGNPLRP